MNENKKVMSASERKAKIRQRYKGRNMDNVHIIPANPTAGIFDETEVKRVAVYARVSTDDPNQTSSYELQKNYYEDLVSKHPNWILVGIYADEGISGTSLNHRDDFIRLMEDCRAGKIDLVLTKSVSRFARNVEDCIHYSRELKNLKPPVGILFETENIYMLYPEKMYVRSGYRAVAKYLGRPDAEARLWELFQEGKPAIDCYLEEQGLLDEKVACVATYRNHMPEIELYLGVKELLQNLKQRNIKIGIITDGRVEGQNNKIDALGLRELADDIIITDELGGEQFRKPCDIAYRIIQRRWKLPFEELVYVGDNAGKDFVAPRSLGMHSIWFDNEDGLYRAACENVAVVKVVSFEKLQKLFCCN